MPNAAKKLPLAIEDIAATTLRGDLRDFLMQWGKNLQKPWAQMSQREQETFRDAANRQAETIVRRVTQLVGSQGFESFEISVGDFQKKGNRLEAKIGAPYSRETLVDLAEAGEAGPIVLSLVSLKQFQGERAPAKVMPDQPDLMDGVDVETGEIDDEQSATAVAGEADKADGAHSTHEQREASGGTYAAERAAAASEPGTESVADGGQDDLARTVAVGQELTEDERQALGPEARANIDRLAGIREIEADGAEAVESTPGDAPKKRGRRSAEERTAANAAAAEGGRASHEKRAE